MFNQFLVPEICIGIRRIHGIDRPLIVHEPDPQILAIGTILGE